MSTRLFSAPIADVNPAAENTALRPLGFVPQGDGSVTVRWADPIDPASPTESLTVTNGAQYPGQIALIVSSDVDLLVYYGIPGETPGHVGGGLATGGGGGGDASAAKQDEQTSILATQLTALTGLSTEVTAAAIKTAIENNGTTLGTLLTEATGAAIKTALEAQGLDIADIKANTGGILTALGSLATGADVSAVKDAVDANGATLTTISTAIASLATAAKQDEIKAVADAMATSLSAIDTNTANIDANTDGVETLLSSIDTKTTADPSTATNQTTANGFLATIAAIATITLTQLRDAIVAVLEAIRDRLPSAFGAGGGVKVDGSGTALPVSAASLPLPSGASTSTLQGAGLPGALTSGGGVKTGLVDALPAGANTIGKVDQGSGGASAWKIDGSAVTQPVSGPLTDTQLRATAVPVSGSVTATISGTPAVTVSSGSVTADTELPAAAALADNTANPTVPGVGAFKMVWDVVGSIWRRAAGDTAGRTVVAGNVAAGTTAALPVTVGGVDTNGKSYPIVGALVGSGVQPFVQQGGGVAWAVDSELPAAAALANNTSNPTAPAVGSFPHVWDGALWQRALGTPAGSQKVTFDRRHLGPFGHLIAQPLSFLTQITFTYGINTYQGTAATSGTGATVDTSNGMLRVQSGTSSSGNASYLSNQPLLYRAGQGMGMMWSQAFTAGVANNTTIGGPSTTELNADGYFFGYKGTSFGIHHYRSGSEVSFTAQASWNGNVPSGFDPTKLNVYDVRYPFLGSGDIFFMVEDSTTGDMFVVHTIRYANTSTILEISNPTLKFLTRSVNTGSTTNVTTLIGSIGEYLVGTRIFNGPPFAYNNQKAVTGSTETNIFSVRVATTLNGVTNRGAARVRLGTAVADNGNTITAFFARLNATLGGSPSFSPYNGSTADNGVTLTSAQSMLSFDTAGTTATGAAQAVAINTGCARNSQVPLDLADLDIILLPGETWTISALPGANTNCAIFVNGLEEW